MKEIFSSKSIGRDSQWDFLLKKYNELIFEGIFLLKKYSEGIVEGTRKTGTDCIMSQDFEQTITQLLD